MSTTTELPVVIVGTGMAGYTVARELRKLDAHKPLVLISEDDGCFYSKPMLSNALAMKKAPHDLVTFDADTMRSQLSARIMTRAQVERIDPQASEIVVDGERLRYASLVLALGAQARRIPLAGNAANEVLSVNSLDDYGRFRTFLQDARSIALLGAGLIGCEFANDLALAGYDVTLIDPASTPLSRLLPEQAGDAFAQALESHGIRMRLGQSVRSVDKHEQRYTLTLSSDEVLKADLVLSAIGLAPRITLAADAGLTIDNGIRTDAWCRTSEEHIYALGDCAAIEGKVQPYVLPIMHAARALARTLAGEPTRVEFPVMPVTVKAPASPTVVVLPDEAGTWRFASNEEGFSAYCEHASDRRALGFALLGKATQSKAALLKAMSSGAF